MDTPRFKARPTYHEIEIEDLETEEDELQNSNEHAEHTEHTEQQKENENSKISNNQDPAKDEVLKYFINVVSIWFLLLNTSLILS